ncbi:hypothetical protein SLS58_008476 [Diplodia intermedia]|uniref:Uncharacterized protein n=1 Tax=Diplodia intermedia TaxID=856260 RepID=A0ABR3THI6_9PEZI
MANGHSEVAQGYNPDMTASRNTNTTSESIAPTHPETTTAVNPVKNGHPGLAFTRMGCHIGFMLLVLLVAAGMITFDLAHTASTILFRVTFHMISLLGINLAANDCDATICEPEEHAPTVTAPVWGEICGYIEKDGEDYGMTNAVHERKMEELQEEHKDEIEEYKTEIDQLKEEARDAHGRADALTYKYNKLSRTHYAAEDKLAEEKERTKRHNEAISAANSTITEKQSEVDALKQVLDFQLAQNAHLNQELGALRATKAQLDEAKRQNKDTTEALSWAHATISARQSEVNTLQQLLNNQLAENAHLHQQLGARQSQTLDQARAESEFHRMRCDQAVLDADRRCEQAVREERARAAAERAELIDAGQRLADMVAWERREAQRARQAKHEALDMASSFLDALDAAVAERDDTKASLAAATVEKEGACAGVEQAREREQEAERRRGLMVAIEASGARVEDLEIGFDDDDDDDALVQNRQEGETAPEERVGGGGGFYGPDTPSENATSSSESGSDENGSRPSSGMGSESTDPTVASLFQMGDVMAEVKAEATSCQMENEP